MTAVLDQVKDVTYTTVGVNLLLTDAIVGHELSAPEFIEEHATLARKQATEALTGFRARTESRAADFEGRFPEQVAGRLAANRVRAWEFIGIDAPKAAAAAEKTSAKAAGKSKSTKKAPAKSKA
jgi:hypothetical protein